MLPTRTAYTVKQFAAQLRVSESTVYRWIKQGKISPLRIGRRRLFIVEEDNISLMVSQIRLRYGRVATPWVPDEIRAYSEWHRLLDELVWLLKICYSPSDDIKRRRFRLDKLFANYIKFHNIDVKRIQTLFVPAKPLKRRLITDDLKRGWYNELSFLV